MIHQNILKAKKKSLNYYQHIVHYQIKEVEKGLARKWLF